ncbi:MAG: HIT domain-containing protein [Flavobacteriales bacterium]|nr:HIT domain-containing protein [Flavobacteriales bacterium]
MENLKSNPNSHLTAIERTSLSYPARILMNQKKIQGKILDFGCGVGKDVELLAAKGFEIKGYDPHYFPEFPTEKFDTILCFYVLNVLLPDEQEIVLKQVKDLLNQNGKAYFAVRRDVYYEGFRMHKLHKKQTYQCQVKLPFETVFKNENCEIYEFQNEPADKCPFCSSNIERNLIIDGETEFAIYDKFPVNEGHALIIPKRHVSNYFELTIEEQKTCFQLVNKVKEIITRKFNPDGFNIGINVGEFAGQTVNHVHIHLIPRYKGDVENPRGGVRGVIPSKQSY